MNNRQTLLTLSAALMLALPATSAPHDHREEKIFNVGESPTIILVNYSGLISVEGGKNKVVTVIGMRRSENVEIDTEVGTQPGADHQSRAGRAGHRGKYGGGL